jgi:hypothetical protein
MFKLGRSSFYFIIPLFLTTEKGPNWKIAACCGRDASRQMLHTTKPLSDIGLRRPLILTKLGCSVLFWVQLTDVTFQLPTSSSRAARRMSAPPSKSHMPIRSTWRLGLKKGHRVKRICPGEEVLWWRHELLLECVLLEF